MIFVIIVVGWFVFKAPNLVWLSVPICFAYHFLKSIIMNSVHQDKPSNGNKSDEFDWWQDNQGL